MFLTPQTVQRDISIAVVDHGRPDLGRFGGVMLSSDGSLTLASSADAMGVLVGAELWYGRRVVLACEAPTSIVPGEYSVERPYESGHPWWKGSGRGAQSLFMVQLPAMLGTAMTALEVAPSVTASGEDFLDGQADLLLIEALVTGDEKTAAPGALPPGFTTHHWDALCIADTVLSMIRCDRTVASNVACGDPHGGAPVVNLAMAAAFAEGMELLGTNELNAPPIVVVPDRYASVRAADLLADLCIPDHA